MPVHQLAAQAQGKVQVHEGYVIRDLYLGSHARVFLTFKCLEFCSNCFDLMMHVPLLRASK